MFQFNHFNFNVLNLEKSLKFYKETLGLDVVREKDASDGSFKIVYLGDGSSDFLLELTWMRDQKEPYNLGDEEFHLALTADDFDKSRGKINVQQSLMERIEGVKNTGIADEIIIEEYEGQKIDDIRRYGVDIFTVGSDWKGKFDYLNEYCKVIYLERTKGVSSSELRSEKRKLRMIVEGDVFLRTKFKNESKFVNGVEIVTTDADAYYLVTTPDEHYEQIRTMLIEGKHVLCESPIASSGKECKELFELAKKQKCVLMEGIKTAYSTAYSRLLLLAKSGEIGKIVSVDATCTSMRDDLDSLENKWNSISAWGPTALLPIVRNKLHR